MKRLPPMDKDQLKKKIRELSVEFEDKKHLIDVLSRVEADLSNEVTEKEKELRSLRPLQVQKEKELTSLEDSVKQRRARLEELSATVLQNSEELQKLRRLDEEIASSTIEAQERTKILTKELKAKDTNEYVPTIQRIARLEQELQDHEKRGKVAEDNYSRMSEDVKALSSQVTILTQAASKMSQESKAKDKVIEQLLQEIEAKRNERYASYAEAENLKTKLTQIQRQRDELEDEKQRLRLQWDQESICG